MPNNIQGEVSHIFLSYDSEIDQAKSGEYVRIEVIGIDQKQEFEIGNVICSSDDPLFPIQEFIGSFLVGKQKSIFAPGYKAYLHCHTVSVPCTIISLISNTDAKTGEKKTPKFCKSGETYIAKMKLDYPICVEKYEKNEKLGMFILVEDGLIATGKILLMKPIH